MAWQAHARTAGSALKRWFIAQLQDAVCVGAMWALGLGALGVPLALVWAALGALFQFIPNFGPLLTLIGPVLAVALTAGGWMKLLYVFILYAFIAVVDGLLLQPYLMRRAAKVPLWASILVPIAMGFIIPFWGVLLAPPLLAVYYTFRAKRKTLTHGNVESLEGELIPPPELWRTRVRKIGRR